jgi:hypothetical protein
LALKQVIEFSVSTTGNADVNVIKAMLVLLFWGLAGHVLASRFFKWR